MSGEAEEPPAEPPGEVGAELEPVVEASALAAPLQDDETPSNPNEPSILESAEKNVIPDIDDALLRGEQIESTDEKKNTRGASIDVEGEGKNTPLHLACAANYDEVVHLLLERGASVTLMNDAMNTPLQLATSQNIRNWLQSVQQGGEAARQKLRQESAEAESWRQAQLKKTLFEKEAAEKAREEAEEANRVRRIQEEKQEIIDEKQRMIDEISFLQKEVERFKQEDAERERLRKEEEERLALEAEKGKKKKGKKK